MHLTADAPANKIANEVDITPYSRGMGAIGLPGDFSSASRFVRAFFAKSNVVAGGGEMGEITAFFHVMGTVSTPSGCVMSENGEPVRTVYTSCADTDSLTYYFTTYENRRVRAVRIRDAEDEALSVFDISGEEDVLFL
jgi:choloylglycine hydrolase